MARKGGGALEWRNFSPEAPSGALGLEAWGTEEGARQRHGLREGELLRSMPGRVTLRPDPRTIHKRFASAGQSLEHCEASSEAERLLWLRDAGIPAPDPLLVTRAPDGCVLVMAAVPGAVPLPEVLRRSRARRIAALCRELGGLVGRLHRAGLRHVDLYLEHVLVADGGEGSLFLIDAGRLRRGHRAGDRWLHKDLAALLHSFPRVLGGRPRDLALGAYLRAMGPGFQPDRGRVLAHRRRMALHRPRHGTVTERPEHLVIRMPNWVGDLVMATPVLHAASRSARFERVTVLVKAGLRPLLEGGPWPGVELVGLRDRRHESELFERLAPDTALLLNHSLGSAWAARGARVPRIAGAAVGGRRLLLTHAVVPPTRSGRRTPYPTAELQRDVAGLLGLEVPELQPLLGRTAAGEANARSLLGDRGPFALCSPGAAKGRGKLWPAQRWAEVLEALRHERGWLPVVVGGPGEEELVAEVARHLQEPHLVSVGGHLGLEGLTSLISRAEVLLVGDSGPRWIAAATRTPCISVMGPNFPGLTASSLERCTVVRLEGLACAPCLERDCPLGHHRCMEDLESEVVLGAARGLITRLGEASVESAHA